MDKNNKNKNKKRLDIALIIICTALLSAAITSAVFMAIINNMSEEKLPNKPTSSSATEPTAAKEKTTDASYATEKATLTALSSDSGENPDTAASGPDLGPSPELPAPDNSSNDVSAPEKLNEMAAAVSAEVSDFEFDQLITVNSYGSFANIGFYEKKKGKWVEAGIEAENGFVGSSGVSADANEYATYTPFGLYSLGTGFGIRENPGTKMEYFQVTENSYWVSDSESRFYNQHVEGVDRQDWDIANAEHLIDYQPNYNYALFIEYNINPAVPGKGSAFFLHVGDSPTAGCVAVSEAKMLEILKWLDPSKSPHILII